MKDLCLPLHHFFNFKAAQSSQKPLRYHHANVRSSSNSQTTYCLKRLYIIWWLLADTNMVSQSGKYKPTSSGIWRSHGGVFEYESLIVKSRAPAALRKDEAFAMRPVICSSKWVTWSDSATACGQRKEGFCTVTCWLVEITADAETQKYQQNRNAREMSIVVSKSQLRQSCSHHSMLLHTVIKLRLCYFATSRGKITHCAFKNL